MEEKASPEWCDGLLQFWLTELGRDVLCEEQEMLQCLLARCFGLHGVQLGLTAETPLIYQAALPHVVVVDISCRSFSGKKNLVQLQSDPSQLALAANSVDMVLIHHGLDVAAQPKAWLREATRILRPGGSLVIVGFNPWSFWGVIRWLCFPWHKAVWLQNPLSVGRLSDWLGVLDFVLVEQRRGCFQMPGRHRLLRWVEPLLMWVMRKYFPGSGAVYGLLARKKTHAMTPWLRFSAQAANLLPGWSLEHPVMSAPVTKPHTKS